MDVLEAIRSRIATRAFLDKAVSRETIEQLLAVSRWAPSGGNLQPWRVSVVTGQTKREITDEIIRARESGIQEHPDYRYYPEEWYEPYISRRRACGYALYDALSIPREDKAKRERQWRENYRFFGAPVGLLFFVERRMSRGAWTDTGILLQTIMLAAQAYGLATCPQASLADYPDVVRRVLGLSDEFAMICAMALGYPNREHPVNRYRTEREDIRNFCRWYD